MAHCLHRSPATISRERHRNGGLQTDQHDKADRFSPERRQRVPRKITFTAKKKAVGRERLKQKGSPDQISNTPEAQGGVSISHERIYKYIFQDKAEGAKRYEHLPWRKKKRKKWGVPETRGQIRHQVSMDQRPHSVETKRFTEIGKWI